MKNLLSQLGDNESILLMYLADELSPRDRAEVEHLLAGDESLRRQLEELRRTFDMVDQAMAAAPPTLPIRAEICAAKTIEAMHAWQAAPPPNRLTLVEEQKKLFLPWWSYPMAAAASVLVAAAVFFANMEPAPISAPFASPVATSVPDLLSSQVLGDLPSLQMDPLAQYAMAEDLAASFDESQRVLGDVLDETSLLEARREASAIQAISQDAFASVDWRW